MFSRVFGEYLISKNYISREIYEEISKNIDSSRVKLGIIAVAEGYMTTQQADEVNRVQAMEDKRFGDIAIEKKYISKEGLEDILSKQGDRYLAFVQNVIERTDITMDQFDKIVDDYKDEYGCTDDEFVAMKSGNVDVILQKTLKVHNPNLLYITGLVVRNIVRFITTDVVVYKATATRRYETEHFAYQELEGDFNSYLGFAGTEGLLVVASRYAKEDFDKVDEDSYDSVCEFTNCINGLFASKFSKEGIAVDMLPPLFKDDAVITTGSGDMYVVDISVEGKPVSIVFSLQEDTTIA